MNIETLKSLGAKLFALFQGRATTSVVFTVCGTVLAFQGKLTMSYVALVGAAQALVVCHSAKEDYFQGKHEQEPTEDEIKKQIL